MVKQAQLDRGKKWGDVRAKAVFENRPKDVEWIDSQETIKTDIQVYEESIKGLTKPEEPIKQDNSKDKKEK